MDALIVGTLNVDDKKMLAEQSLALASMTLAFSDRGDTKNSVLDELARLPANEFTLVNSYFMKPPTAVVYKHVSDDTEATKTAEAMAAAFETLTGASLPVRGFSGRLHHLDYDSFVLVDPSLIPLNGNPRFQLADVSRQKLMSQRPDGGDCNSGLAATGRLSAAFMDLMKSFETRAELGLAHFE